MPAGAGEVEVVYARPDRQAVVKLALPPGGLTAGEALQQSGLLQAFPEIGQHPLVLGVFGTRCDPARRLQSGDRLEIYRPLPHDPRTARRERAGVGMRRRR